VVVDHLKMKTTVRPSEVGKWWSTIPWHPKLEKVVVDHKKLKSGGRPSEEVEKTVEEGIIILNIYMCT
jgi:hypothetical protein